MMKLLQSHQDFLSRFNTPEDVETELRKLGRWDTRILSAMLVRRMVKPEFLPLMDDHITQIILQGRYVDPWFNLNK